MLSSMPAQRMTVAVVAAVLVACGSSPTSATSSPTPRPSPIDAKDAVARPGDFPPQALTACPSPETGDMAGFAAAYNHKVPYYASFAAVAAVVAQANPDNWVSSLAAPDASPAVCKGNLGFGYTPRKTGKEPSVTSMAYVFKDDQSAATAYASAQPYLVRVPSTSRDATGLGANSAISDSGGSQLLIWQHGKVVSYLLTQDVDNWLQGAKAVDSRLAQ